MKNVPEINPSTMLPEKKASDKQGHYMHYDDA
jgi:hypothetical protein